MSRKEYEEYVENQATRHPLATRADLVLIEKVNLYTTVVAAVVVYGLVVWALWVFASPEFAKGAGFAYLGFTIGEVTKFIRRIRAFKRLMPED
jgi:hypothetical protein